MTTIQACLVAVMGEVTAVGKNDKNTHQGFNFRGIDAVVNAVGPALRKHHVVVMPEVVDYTYGEIEIGKDRKLTGHAKVKVRYSFYGPEGDALTTTVVAESMDSGDKATAKAMSVAFRTALLQALCLPTNEPDPDASTYERAEPKPRAGKPKPVKAAVDVLPVEVSGPWMNRIHQCTNADELREVWKELNGEGILDSAFDDSLRTMRDAVQEWLTHVSE